MEFVPLLDLEVHSVFGELFPELDMDGKHIQVRVFNLQNVKRMRDLNPSGMLPVILNNN